MPREGLPPLTDARAATLGLVARLVLVRPGSGAPDLLPLEAWQALTSAPVFAAPGDPLAERLREAGYEVATLTEAEPSRLRSETPGRDAAGMLGRNLLASHAHGEVGEGARALAGRLAELAGERGEIAFILNDEAVTRAVELGANVIDTAANYRFQRSERSIGAALRQLGERAFGRDRLAGGVHQDWTHGRLHCGIPPGASGAVSGFGLCPSASAIVMRGRPSATASR